MQANARLAENFPEKFAMILLDGTPGPTWPSWIASAKPDSMKGKYCFPLFWEIGYSYSTQQWFYFLGLHWWPKGANFLLEIKYHLLRALFTQGVSAQVSTFFDQFDGGSENRNYPNFSFLAELAEHEGVEVVASRLVVGHTHNEGDARIKAPRAACESRALRCLGDVASAMIRSSCSGKPPIVVIVRNIHDWAARANAAKNPHLKHVTEPHVWKIAPTPGSHSGLLFKNNYNSHEWLGADGVPDGRPVSLFADTSQLSTRPSVVPRFRDPFSSSVRTATETAIKQIGKTSPTCAANIAEVLASGGSDNSLGLKYNREFKDGQVGFPGSLSTSDGGEVAVRVLAGLPEVLWGWRKPRAAPEPSGSAAPAASISAPAAITDEPPTVPRKARRARGEGKDVAAWVCRCGKCYKAGIDSKRAVTHRSRCPAPNAQEKKCEEDGDERFDSDASEDGEEAEDDDGGDDEVDKEESDDEGDPEDSISSEDTGELEETEQNRALQAARNMARPKRKPSVAKAGASPQVDKAGKRRRKSVQLLPVEIQKEYWGPPKPCKDALTQRLYKVKFDDGSLQVVLAEDTIDNKVVVVDNLPSYKDVIRQWREQNRLPPPKPASERKKGSNVKRGKPVAGRSRP
jgi:hypothetical protein